MLASSYSYVFVWDIVVSIALFTNTKAAWGGNPQLFITTGRPVYHSQKLTERCARAARDPRLFSIAGRRLYYLQNDMNAMRGRPNFLPLQEGARICYSRNDLNAVYWRSSTFIIVGSRFCCSQNTFQVAAIGSQHFPSFHRCEARRRRKIFRVS